jgi:hypothetical protein
MIAPATNRVRSFCILCMILVIGGALTGCARNARATATTFPATVTNPATTQPAYWLDQPANASARFGDFSQLFQASEDSARDFLFRIDRVDYRAGLLTTRPMVSAQWFEFWRRDTQTWDDLAESSLATIRRTIRFEFVRLDDGSFEVTPKVLVERETVAESRVTSPTNYRRVFHNEIDPRRRARGTRESDVGTRLPGRYWTPIGRDPALEEALARSIEKKVARPTSG